MDERLRLADLLAALSLATDLGTGQRPEEAMRTCVLATSLARREGRAESDVSDAYWTALLMHVGCTAFAHEQAAFSGGEDIAVTAIAARTDFDDPRQTLAFLVELGRGKSLPRRARLLLSGLLGGERFAREAATATCEVAAGMAPRLGLPSAVGRGLHELFERWDGSGAPRGLAGEAIALPARFAQVAALALVFYRLGGADAAIETARQRAGTELDPDLVDSFSRHGRELLEEVGAADPWDAVIDAEPEPRRWIADSGVDDIARAFADAIDLKSTYTLGHSPGVADLAAAAGRELDWAIATSYASAARHSSMTQGGSACRTGSGRSRGRSR